MYRIESHLHEIPLEQLRPTQMTVGFREVEKKRESWAELGDKARRKAMDEQLFPVVKGPDKAFYVLDAHHTALALVHEKADSVQAGLVKDLSHLDRGAFWIFLDHHSWMHAYDAKGKRRPFSDMPRRFEDMQDDPYRSLSGDVRDAGGFAKAEEPFLEFLWANYFRGLVPLRLVKSDPKEARRKAMALASTKAASHLPGWCGKR
jgi:hypothetical protein